MLYIICAQTNFTWHVGEPSPITRDAMRHVQEVQADCDELDYVQRQFRTLPRALGKRVVRWFGDDAKFIAANL